MEQFIQSVIFRYINPQTTQGIVISSILLIWSLLWKAFGLWKSARNNERVWFIAIIFLNTIGIIEIAYLFFFAKDRFTLERIQSNFKSYKIKNPLKNPIK